MIKKAIPSALTSMNMLCGFWALLINDPIISFYLVLVAIAFDFVDGLSARALKVQSMFGAELDSLADMVTFGVVPGFLFFHHALYQAEDNTLLLLGKMLLATLIPVCAGLRLAKFNVKDSGKMGFVGMPSSASALMVISIPFLGEDWFSIAGDWTRYFVPIIFSLLMVSNLPMFSLKGLNLGWKANIYPIIYAVTLLPAIFFLGWMALPFSIIWYLALSLLYGIRYKVTNRS
ncbi:CDP-alcohol phosphatidyltransferase family protein [Salibacteraceae bacterium]|nr:CDP-alcohol phosphatidyltransferase family protein [Salibacteraceae bacterium]